jgi:hypothetical protein
MTTEQNNLDETLSLKDFIKSTLQNICDAVEEVREEYPYIAKKSDDTEVAKTSTLIDFDIAVTVSGAKNIESKDGASVGGGLQIGVLRFGTKINDEKKSEEKSDHSQVSRIQFSIPVYFRADYEAIEARRKKQDDLMKRPMSVNRDRI